jgi:hypothetical protein
MDLITLWFVLAVVVGIVAAALGRSGPGWFLLAVIISPLLAGIVLLLVGRAGVEPPSPSTHVKCPDCRELVLNEARVCKHCGCRLVPQA